MTTYVIDTNVFYSIKKKDEDFNLSTIILEKILESHCIAVDDEEQIMAEYEKAKVLIRNPMTLVLGPFWNHMFSNAGKILYKKPLIKSENIDELSSLGFDKDDLIFIAVANSTDDKLIITKDSDFGIRNGDKRKFPRIKRYLESVLGVQALTICEGSEHVKSV